MSSQDRWKEFEVGKDAILRLEQESEQVDYGYHGCDKGLILEGMFEWVSVVDSWRNFMYDGWKLKWGLEGWFASKNDVGYNMVHRLILSINSYTRMGFACLDK